MHHCNKQEKKRKGLFKTVHSEEAENCQWGFLSANSAGLPYKLSA
jgi:hypothetical protein